MAQEKGKVVGFQPMMYNGNRKIWESNNGTMYAWEVDMDMNGNVVKGKVFTKNPDRFPVEVGTEVTFETDWNTKYGPAYFKRVKDVNRAPYNSGGNQGGGNYQRQPAAPQQSYQAPQKTAPAPTNEDVHKEKMLIFSAKYIKFISTKKELSINPTTVIQLAFDPNGLSDWVKAQSNQLRAERALRVAIDTLELDHLMVSLELDIKSKDDLLAMAQVFYEAF